MEQEQATVPRGGKVMCADEKCLRWVLVVRGDPFPVYCDKHKSQPKEA